MSLQVWLPLTKDLRNQGLSNITATNSGATYSSTGGKLGGCYSFDGTDDAIGVGNLSTIVDTDFSWSCWFYRGEWSSKSWETIFGGPSGFELETKSGSTNSPLMYAYSWGKGTFTYELNQWNHLVMTRTTSETKFYLNGELKLTGNAGSIPSGNYFVGSWSSTTGQNFKGKVNDVRIYDHCLSPMEVKWLSQGLVLHYPLNRNGWGQENLATQYVVPGGNGPLVTTTAGRTVYYGKYGITIPTTENADTYFSIYIKQALESGKKYTLSCEVNGLSNGSYYCFPLFAQNNSSMGLLKLDHNGLCSLTFTMNYTGTVATSTVDGVTLYRLFMDDITRSIASGQGAITVTNIKLEEGDKVTPWCPASIDSSYTTMGLNSTTEYDCSGFCNNGNKITNTITYTSDTAKYAVSTHFNGTYDGIIIENLALKDIINSAVTYAFWIKPESESGARSVYFGSYNTGPSWSIEKTTGNVIRSYWNGSPDETCSGATITDGVWQHVCLTKSGTNDIKIYINGVQKWASTATHSNLNFPTTFRIGRDTRSNDGTPYKGLMSDFRIYATALSAEDVKSLYQNCATIDPDGTIHGQIRS